jgi:hypothetical protein
MVIKNINNEMKKGIIQQVLIIRRCFHDDEYLKN